MRRLNTDHLVGKFVVERCNLVPSKHAAVYQPVSKHLPRHGDLSRATHGATCRTEAGDCHRGIIPKNAIVTRVLLAVQSDLDLDWRGFHQCAGQYQQLLEPMVVHR